MTSPFTRLASTLALLLASRAALAHTGHGTSGLSDGLLHPFGLDHLLAMLAVGIWSVSALPDNKVWQGPVTFMSALLLSAGIGATGLLIPHLENLIAASVVLFGVMLFIPRTLPVASGLWLVAFAASLHGMAHGAEAPGENFATYALGFMLSTATLHAGGVIAGMLIRHLLNQKAPLALRFLGMGCSAAGLYLLGQLTA